MKSRSLPNPPSMYEDVGYDSVDLPLEELLGNNDQITSHGIIDQHQVHCYEPLTTESENLPDSTLDMASKEVNPYLDLGTITVNQYLDLYPDPKEVSQYMDLGLKEVNQCMDPDPKEVSGSRFERGDRMHGSWTERGDKMH